VITNEEDLVRAFKQFVDSKFEEPGEDETAA
jgi:hypothetical protein